MESFEIVAPAAWGIPVWTERLGGGKPVLVLYAAAIPNQADARAAVSEYGRLAEGDEAGTLVPLSDETVAAIGLAPGAVKML